MKPHPCKRDAEPRPLVLHNLTASLVLLTWHMSSAHVWPVAVQQPISKPLSALTSRGVLGCSVGSGVNQALRAESHLGPVAVQQPVAGRERCDRAHSQRAAAEAHRHGGRARVVEQRAHAINRERYALLLPAAPRPEQWCGGKQGFPKGFLNTTRR